jgi:glyoxylase-like metal-dependent hydrolase (beta-lactamase superfamily II)
MRNKLLGALLLAVAACGGGAPFGEAEVDGPYGIKGYRTQGAFFWVVPLPEGVVVVDTGDDLEATKLKEVIGTRTLLGVLITHGHQDHTAGAAKLGNVRVLAGREDVTLIRGDRPQESAVGRAASLRPDYELPEAPQGLEAVDDGHVFRVGSDTFTSVALPGHTRGSMAWLFRDVLFGGDSAMGDDSGVGPAPFVFSEDPKAADEVVRTLNTVPFKTLLDGHNGRTDDADKKVPGYRG